jgi:glycosyltransferase involved in cell wall biosynthesis
MRIFYDGFIYDFQAHGGINRYLLEIIHRLPSEFTPVLSTFIGDRGFWPDHPRLTTIRARPFARLPSLQPLGLLSMSLQVACSRCDLAHPTYYQRLTPGSVRRLGRPLVITVHDMIHEIYPDQIDPLGVVRTAKRDCIQAADAILCNSQHTRRDLIERFPEVETRTVVTPLASSMSLDAQALTQIPPHTRPSFLYVGGREGYKNFGFLLEAWARFSKKFPDAQLRVVGSRWSAREQERIAELALGESILHQGPVDDRQLSALYHRSLALIYPSRYEGFGIPPLEAMRCGTAVICARSSSLPEVGGDAPLYFSPDDAYELLAHMSALIETPSLREIRVRLGAAQAARFDWTITAAQTLAVYRQLAS